MLLLKMIYINCFWLLNGVNKYKKKLSSNNSVNYLITFIESIIHYQLCSYKRKYA